MICLYLISARYCSTSLYHSDLALVLHLDGVVRPHLDVRVLRHVAALQPQHPGRRVEVDVLNLTATQPKEDELVNDDLLEKYIKIMSTNYLDGEDCPDPVGGG